MKTAELESLRLRVGAFFVAKGYKEECIKRYNHTWDHLKDFMEAHTIALYSVSAGKQFLDDWHGGRSFSELTHREQERVRHITVLDDMLEDGRVKRNHRPLKTYDFGAEEGEPFRRFLAYQSTIKRRSSIQRYEERIYALCIFLREKGRTIGDMDTRLLIQFVAHLDRTTSVINRNNIIMSNRVFLRYLCEQGVLSDNKTEKWMSLLRFNHRYTKKIPSVYTTEEVERIIACIDRTHPQGKRDYAMILLAARYGLRASDIISLRFNNIDWEANKIVISQMKTNRNVVLPLSEEVGNALIDYIRNARPKIDTPFVFISAMAPYRPLRSNILCQNVADAMRTAGIDSTGRKVGPHALRHSLASNLLQANQTLPVISEILGHSSTQSTMTYLRVDLDHLRQCALDVPFVPSTFYTNLYAH